MTDSAGHTGIEGVLFFGRIQARSWGKLHIYHSWRHLFRLEVTYPSLLSHRSNSFKNLNGIKNWFYVAPEESLKTRATAGIAREPAPHALIGAVHAHLFPGITWSGIQKWFYFRKMLDCLLLTWRADAEGGKICPGTRYQVPIPLLLHWPVHCWHFWFLLFSVLFGELHPLSIMLTKVSPGGTRAHIQMANLLSSILQPSEQSSHCFFCKLGWGLLFHCVTIYGFL